MDEGTPQRRPHGSATRLQLVTDAAELGIWDWDLLSNDIVYSERAKAILGLPPSKPVSLEQVRKTMHPDDYPQTSAQRDRALDPAIREHKPYEYRCVHPDGSIRWVIAHGRAVFDTVDGAVRATRYIGTIQDITARKQTEESLRLSNARLQLAIEAGRMAVWEFDAASGMITTSPELNRLLGFGEDEKPTLEQLRARYAPGEQDRVRKAALAAIARGERFFQVEFRYLWPNGSVRWLLLRAEIQFSPEKQPVAIIGVVLDVTDQKEHEHHLETLMHELSHRSKNLMAVVQAIARQTVRRAASFDEFESSFLGRIQSLARAHDLLVKANWRGASLADVVRTQLRDVSSLDTRIDIDGPPVVLTNSAAQSLATAIHELAANARRHGALSNASGRVRVSWHIEGTGAGTKALRFSWEETGGPQVTPRARSGFGSHVLESMAGSAPGREASLEFAPEGVRWTMAWPERDFSLPG
jgi:PAS domain S-box-containing protein